jgi:hypothetical protein
MARRHHERFWRTESGLRYPCDHRLIHARWGRRKRVAVFIHHVDAVVSLSDDFPFPPTIATDA